MTTVFQYLIWYSLVVVQNYYGEIFCLFLKEKKRPSTLDIQEGISKRMVNIDENATRRKPECRKLGTKNHSEHFFPNPVHIESTNYKPVTSIKPP
jgi:hypothetical protein